MQIAGMKVVNAAKPLKITITKRDVTLGANKDPAACAAARALVRQTGCTQARVHLGRTYLQEDDKWVRYNTPESIRSEIVSFDRGGGFAPGEYTLPACQPSHRASGKRQGSNRRPVSKKMKKKRAKPHFVSGVRAHGANR
jgi:hypothetical protein